ncbi:MAG: GNAT family N-acetyltransferase [Acidobacteria bacterium]|nr:GNAT family N-acetyltransferase [Acidobacteriota bacterium]
MAGVHPMIRPGGEADRGAVNWPLANEPFLVYEREGRILGHVVFHDVFDNEYELLYIEVDAAARRQGIARALISALPAGRIFLEVRESNTAARELYKRAGFVETGRRKLYYRDPPEDGIVMELKKW